MRICLFTDSFLPYISGVSSAVFNQANELAARGHEVTIFHPRPKREDRLDQVAGLNPEIKLSYQFSYDISVDALNFEDYLVRYLPKNNCWFIEFKYFSDRIQSRYSLNFMLNLNEKQFKRNARL